MNFTIIRRINKRAITNRPSPSFFTGRGLWLAVMGCFANVVLFGASNESGMGDYFIRHFDVPPAYQELTYKITRNGATHFGIVKLQRDAFLVKTANTREHLKASRLYGDTKVAGHVGDVYWYFDSGQEPTLRVSDAVTRLDTNSLSAKASGIVTGCYGVAMEGLNVSFFSTPAWSPKCATWSNLHLTGRGWFDQPFDGKLLLSSSGLPEEMRVKISFVEDSPIFQILRYHYSQTGHTYYPTRTVMYKCDANALDPQEIAAIDLISIKTNAYPLPDSTFAWQAALNVGVSEVLAYTNGAETWSKYDDSRQGKVPFLGFGLPKMYLSAIYITSVFILSIGIVAFTRLARQR